MYREQLTGTELICTLLCILSIDCISQFSLLELRFSLKYEMAELIPKKKESTEICHSASCLSNTCIFW